MQEVIRIIPWVILVLLFFTLFYLVHKKFKENNVWKSVTTKYREEMDKKLEHETLFVSKYGNIENKSIFYKLDRLILTSGLRKYMPWMNGEKYFFILILSVLCTVAAGLAITGNTYIALFIGAAIFVAIYAIVLALSGRIYNQIEDATSIFVSILSNHATGSTDIITIMQRSRASLQGTLYDLVGRFLLDAEKTGSSDLAFDYFRESIDNRQLKVILSNLKTCSRYQANYEEVLAQMMGQIAASLSAREDRKNILFSMKLTLIVISIASVIIVALIGKGIGVDVKGILTGNMVGQGILFITGLLYLFVVVKLFGTDK